MAEPHTVILPAPVLDGLDRWIEEQPDPKPSRTDAIQLAVIDWLVALGHFSVRELPEGPNQGH